jgi:hypothetical protein
VGCKNVNHDVLIKTLDYDGATGVFIWKHVEGGNPSRNTIWAGKVAGSVTRRGYAVITLDGDTYLAHQLAWFYSHGAWPVREIDHINGVRNDNRLSNLRDISKADNLQNQRSAHKQNKSGLLGVYKFEGRWRSCIKSKGKTRHLGVFESAQAAHEAYVLAKREAHACCTI